MSETIIRGENLEIAYGENVLLRDGNFAVKRGDIFIIMGGSGSGKSSLLKTLIGLKEPKAGRVFIRDEDFYQSDEAKRRQIMQGCGVLYQSGALFSSMTIGENAALPLQQYSTYSPETIAELVELKLALVGLQGYRDFYPDELSGGMKKRASLARALALDPDILYFDEPSSGLDPVSSRLQDELILEINANQGTTIVVISHDVDSILTIGNNAIYLDGNAKQITAAGSPQEWLRNPPNAALADFFKRRRGE
ncbi:MAG: ATP-binding cassette domain-containing protein [Alphaproteobacteria bacterium]|nr:ATP-binding cassette domain-containing protein [Alphaproteobacteria bacterium]